MGVPQAEQPRYCDLGSRSSPGGAGRRGKRIRGFIRLYTVGGGASRAGGH